MISGDTVFFVSHSDSRRLTSLYRIRYIRSFLVGVYSADEFRSTTRALDVRAHPPYCRIVRPALRSLLQQLQDAHIPVLWRPMHENNGTFFWWGGRPGQSGTAQLYRELYYRMVNVHHLNN